MAVEFETTTRKQLTEIAYMACMGNDVARARRILDGLVAAHPGSVETTIGFALADITAGDFNAAINRLRPLSEAGDVHGTVFLGLGLRLAGRSSECEAVLARLPPGDPAADKLAAALR